MYIDNKCPRCEKLKEVEEPLCETCLNEVDGNEFVSFYVAKIIRDVMSSKTIDGKPFSSAQVEFATYAALTELSGEPMPDGDGFYCMSLELKAEIVKAISDDAAKMGLVFG